MNIFEGGRRFTKIFCWIWAILSALIGWYIYHHNPGVSLKFGLMVILGGIVAISIVSDVIGYIVRGFMDIPSGRDTNDIYIPGRK